MYVDQEEETQYTVSMSANDLRLFSLETNNMPWTNNTRDATRFNKWARIHKFIQRMKGTTQDGYIRLPDTELAEINAPTEENTLFSRETGYNTTDLTNTEPNDISIDIPPEEEINTTTLDISTPSSSTATETTALLGDVIGEGVTAGTVTGAATDGLLAIAGTTAGAAVVAGVGIGIDKLIHRTKEKGLVLPHSEYIGPGNPIPISAARNKPDQIAKDHDVGYTNLIKEARRGTLTEDEFKIKLHRLDSKAIQDFEDEVKASGSWNAWIGAKGLKLKQTFENMYRPVYPKYKKTFNKDDIQSTLEDYNITPQELHDHPMPKIEPARTHMTRTKLVHITGQATIDKTHMDTLHWYLKDINQKKNNIQNRIGLLSQLLRHNDYAQNYSTRGNKIQQKRYQTHKTIRNTLPRLTTRRSR